MTEHGAALVLSGDRAERGWVRVETLAREAADRHGAAVAVAARLVGADRTWSLAGRMRVPAASTIKTAILVAFYREVDAAHLRLDDERMLDPAVKTPGSGVLAFLRDGLALTLADLAALMIAVSDNTASNLLLDAVGLDCVRATIADLGLRDTALNRRFLGRAPDPGTPDNLTSAADLAALLAAIAEGTAASTQSCASMRETLALQQDRDRLARHLPPALPFGGKSGSLPGLAHDSGLIGTPAGPLALAVLTRGFADRYVADETIGQIALALVEAAGT